MAKIMFLTEEISRATGIVRVVSIWANYFSESNHDIQIIAGEINKPYYKLNSKVKLKKWNFLFQKKIIGIPYNIMQTYRLLKKFAKEDNINLIVDRAIHVEPIWVLRKLGLFKNINLIYFAHGGSSDFRDFYMSRFWTKHKVKMIFDAFDKVICLFDDEKNYPKEVKKEKLHFIANPLPFEPSSMELSHKENIVLSLGRVTKEKGIDTLIKSWVEVEKKVKDWKLEIVGDGKDKDDFIALSKKLNLKNIEFIPSTTDVKSYYERAKIFVIPSLFEGMPMTILEAMACKCCVVSTKTAGGNKLINHKKTGVLVKIGEKEVLADELAFLLENDETIKSYANNAFEYVQEYKIDTIAKNWKEVLL